MLFTTPTEVPFSLHILIPQFQKHFQRVGFPAIRFQDLRHSCTSLLLAQGAPPRSAMVMLERSTIMLTMNTYSHVLPAAQRDAAMLLETFLATGDK